MLALVVATLTGVEAFRVSSDFNSVQDAKDRIYPDVTQTRCVRWMKICQGGQQVSLLTHLKLI